MSQIIRTYKELNRIATFKERYEYLRLAGIVGESTFGFDRYLNQILYKSRKWLKARDDVIIRDCACDLGMIGYEIVYRIYIHHMNPISAKDVEDDRDDIYNPEFLICTSQLTHLAIHYGYDNLIPKSPIVRRPNDTVPWR